MIQFINIFNIPRQFLTIDKIYRSVILSYQGKKPLHLLSVKGLVVGTLTVGLSLLSGCEPFDDSSSTPDQSMASDSKHEEKSAFGNNSDIDDGLAQPEQGSTVNTNAMLNVLVEDHADLAREPGQHYADVTVEKQSITVEERSCSVTSTLPAPNMQNSPLSIDSVILADQRILSNEDATPKEDDYCQFSRLITLRFEPSMPWVEELIAKNIALIMNPDLIFADLDDHANQTVLEMLEYIESSDKRAKQLPLYLWLTTDFEQNSNGTAFVKLTSIQRRSRATPKLYYERYIMLDMARGKQLQIDDILQSANSKNELLSFIQLSEKQWLSDRDDGAFDGDHFSEGWPFHLAQQWYMSDAGLYLLYQPGENISGAMPQVDSFNSHIVEIFVPYTSLAPYLDPKYRLLAIEEPSILDATDDTDTDTATVEAVQVTTIPIDIKGAYEQY